MNSKKVAILGTVGLPAKYGGFETLTDHLTKYLSNDYDITVYCSGKSYEEELSTYNGATLKYINLNANGVQSILYDIISIIRACYITDTLLILGVSGCIILPIVKLISSNKLVVNIDGQEWKRNKWSKYTKWFLKYSEKLAVKYADIVITDNKVIQEYVKNEYGIKSELIAYGANHVQKRAIDQKLLEDYIFLKRKYAFSVCRIEPENNIHIIIEALAQQNELCLVIIGNWDASQYGKLLRIKYANKEHIFLMDPIYDQDKLNQIRSNCVLYLHGHSAGGTNPSLVEAMHLELPIFAFDVAYNKETTDYEAKYFASTIELSKLIENIDNIPLLNIAKKMLEISEKRYQWDTITKQYSLLF